ncbi:hypothetical protein HY387_01235 [Candidatus Daviesbacteria bacterium]|nr:hypothetical protein [Candidatus Daviesbacteria bacterium]
MNEQPKLTSNGFNVIWLIMLLVLIIVVAGGYLYFREKNTQLTTPQSSTQTIQDLSGELNTLNIGDESSDFSALDQDIQNL